MNLSPARLAVIVALVVGGVAVLLNGFEGSTDAAAAGRIAHAERRPSARCRRSPASPTDDPTDTPAPETDGVTFMVFNGTSTTGLGAHGAAGSRSRGVRLHAATAGNALTVAGRQDHVYFRGGADAVQNESNATYMAEEFLGGAAVKLLGVDYETRFPTTPSWWSSSAATIESRPSHPAIPTPLPGASFRSSSPSSNTSCSASDNTSGENGLVRNASAPSCRHRR